MHKTDLKDIRLFLLDMDGTLYLGDRLFDFTIQLLEQIKRSGGQYLFLTNNSSKGVEDYVKKLSSLGIPARPEDFMTSSQATAYYLRKEHPGKTLYICGTESLKQELRSEGFSVTDELSQVECIVVGFDTELTFQKLRDVCFLLNTRPDLPYIATNPDLVCPTEFGFVPDCGSICAAIRNATGRDPVVIGKPSPLMPLLATERMGVPPSLTCVVGDRIYTDVKCALESGCKGVLVLSGETTPEILAASQVKPDLVLESGQDILNELIKEASV